MSSLSRVTLKYELNNTPPKQSSQFGGFSLVLRDCCYSVRVSMLDVSQIEKTTNCQSWHFSYSTK